MGETTDYSTYFSEEIQKFAKDAVFKDARWMAVIVKAMYKKYGRDAIDVLNDAFFEFGKAEGEKYKKLAGYEGREDEIDVQVALQDIYPQVHMHAGAAGLILERIHFEPEESISHCHQCPMFEGWKDVWDEPWFMCEFISYHHDRGFMAGLNPKFEWTEHAEKDGAPGLARAKGDPCRMHLVLHKDEEK
jgi:hypothetical protein